MGEIPRFNAQECLTKLLPIEDIYGKQEKKILKCIKSHKVIFCKKFVNFENWQNTLETCGLVQTIHFY